MGLERIVLLLQEKETRQFLPDFYLVSDNAAAALMLSEKCRDIFPSIKIEMNMGEGSFSTQLKRADKSGARFALIIGESEAKAAVITVKDLRAGAEQHSMTLEQLTLFLEKQS